MVSSLLWNVLLALAASTYQTVVSAWVPILLGVVIVALLCLVGYLYWKMNQKNPRPVTAYFDEAYDKRAEHDRGILLLALIFLLLVIDLSLWVGHHVPWLFQGNYAWVYPSLPAAGQTEPSPANALGSSLIDWLLAGFAGALLFGLVNIAKYLPKVKYKKADFRAFTGWYFVNILQGGMVAVIVLLLLTNLSIAIGQDGLDLNFAQMPGAMLTGIAFVLGFYGHVAKAQLDEVTSSLFHRAWLVAEGRFKIALGDWHSKVIFGKQHQFKVEPPADVVWSASIGAIDNAGLYTAPQKSDTVKPGTTVQIRAALQADPTVSDVVNITLVPFILLADKLVMIPGESQQLRLDNAPTDGACLEAIYGEVQGLRYTAPVEAQVKEKGISADTITASLIPPITAPDDPDARGKIEAARLECDTISIRIQSNGLN